MVKRKEVFYKRLFYFFVGRNRRPIDTVILFLVLVLFAFGFAMVCSVESVRFGSSEMIKQLLFGLIGIGLMILVAASDYRIFNSYLSPLFFGVTIGLNLINALRAIRGGSIDRGGSFQASELLKFALVALLAYILCACEPIIRSRESKKRTRDGKALRAQAKTTARQFEIERRLISNIRTELGMNAVVFLLTVGCFFIVLLQSHLSGAIIVLLIGFVIMLAGGANKKFLFILAGVGIAFVVVVIIYPEILKKIPGIANYMYERVALWRNKYTVSMAASEGFTSNRTQVEASLKAIGSGGWFGLGYNNSIQKQAYLAESKTDFILAVVVEELGYLRTLLLLALFGFLIYRCVRIATTVKDKFASLLVLGIAAQIGLELLLNIAVVTDSMPNTGITLPFFSYGGSALIMLFVEMGFVLSISKYSTHTLKQNKWLSRRLAGFNGTADEEKENGEVRE